MLQVSPGMVCLREQKGDFKGFRVEWFDPKRPNNGCSNWFSNLPEAVGFMRFMTEFLKISGQASLRMIGVIYDPPELAELAEKITDITDR